MAKRLTESGIAKLATIGTHGDGGRGSFGLQLRVHRTKGGHLTRSFRQVIRIGGKVTTLGLGSWPYIGLEDARTRCLENIVAVRRGMDPRSRTRAVKAAPVARSSVHAPRGRTDERTAPTFAELVEEVIKDRRPNWSPVTEGAWRNALHHAGKIMVLRVDAIGSRDVMDVLQPLAREKPSVAKRLLSYIGITLQLAIAREHRDDNPAGAVKESLKASLNGRKVQNHPALPHGDVAGALATIRARGLAVADMIEFVTLTASRINMVLGMKWTEIDGDTWTCPRHRMKGRRAAHRIPLSEAALAVLARARKATGPRGLVFPNTQGRPFQRARGAAAFRTCGIKATPHGMRSSFRDWCAETGVAREVAEAQLAHAVAGVEAAYLRTDVLERRRPVMEKWGRYIS